MKLNRLFLWIILFPCAMLLAQPNHTHLWYSDKLDQPTTTAFSEFVNRGGVFIAGKGWQAKTTNSQLFIALPYDLPSEGTMIINVNGFNPIKQNSDVKHNIINFYSQPNGSKDIFDTDGAWWNIRTGSGYTQGPGTAGFKFLAAPRGIDTREEIRCIEWKSDWKESSWYEFKVVWTRDEIYCYFDKNIVCTLPFKGQVEMFRYIFIGTDNVYTAMAGPIYANLRILSAAPNPATTFNLSMISGNEQTGAPLQSLASPFVVQVTNGYGDGKANVPVSFAPNNGATMIEAQPVTTDADGYARSTLRLGEGDGRYTTIVSSEITGDSQVQFYADAVTPDVFSLVAVSGDAQTGEPKQPLEQPFVVRVHNQNGVGTAGAAVTFAPQNGGAMVEPQPVTTDADGFARSTLIFGENEGPYSVVVTSDKTDAGSVTFIATAVKPKVTISKSSGDGQTGTVGQPLAAACVVQALDDRGRPEVVDVEFRVADGSGSLDGAAIIKVTTDASGNAAVQWTLGSAIGEQRLYAAFEETTLLFTATAVAGTPHQLLKATDNAEFIAGKSYPFAVKLEDAFGNPCAGAPINFVVDSGKGHLSGSAAQTVSTDAAGVAETVWTLGVNHTYPQQMSAKLEGSTDTLLTAAYLLQNVTPPSLASSFITADSTALADGDDSAVIRVILKNDDGLPLSDYVVRLKVFGRDNQLAIDDSLTNAEGVMTAKLSSTVAEIKTATALVVGVGNVPGSVNIAFREPHVPYYHLMAVAGNNQTGIVGASLPQPVIAWVVDESSRAQSGIRVRFEVVSGDGRVNGQSVFETMSDGSGLAQAQWTLGTRASGLDSLRVTLPERMAAPLYFTARALAGAPHLLVPLTIDSLMVTAGEIKELGVRVFDEFGNPTPKTPVMFEALLNGSVLESSVPADSTGFAKSSAVMGSKPGAAIFQAKVEPSLSQVWTFNVTLVKERLIAVPVDTIKLSERRDVELAVICVDGSGVPMSGVPVQFSRRHGEGDFVGSALAVSSAGGYGSVVWRPMPSTETAVILAQSPHDSVYFYIRLNLATVVNERVTPEGFALGDNYPNPFNPSTVIPFTLPEAGHVMLQVYDVNGRLMRTLIDGHTAAGSHAVTFNALKDDGETMPSGIYFYKLVAGEFQAVRQLLLIK